METAYFETIGFNVVENVQLANFLERLKSLLLQKSKTGSVSAVLLELLSMHDWERNVRKIVWVLTKEAKMYRFPDGSIGQFLGAGEQTLYAEVHVIWSKGDEASKESKRSRRRASA